MESPAVAEAAVEAHVPVIDPNPAPEPRHGSIGSVIAILLIVFLLVAGAFYVWGQRLSEERAQQYVPATAP